MSFVIPFMLALCVFLYWLGTGLNSEGLAGTGLIAGIFIIVASLVILPLMLLEQVDNITTVQYGEQQIKVYDSRIAGLQKQLQALPAPSSALLNADTPYAALVTSVSKAVEAKADAETEILKAKRDITARRKGLFGWLMFLAN